MEIPPNLTKEDRQLRDYINQNGFKDIDKILKPMLDKWREVEVNIAVTGIGSWKIKFYQRYKRVSTILHHDLRPICFFFAIT